MALERPSRVIVIGASVGGVAALLEVASALPADLDAAVGIVLHIGAQPSILPELLAVRAQLPVAAARHNDFLHGGRIYVAPPDYHMQFSEDAVLLSRGPRENHARPAIDPLFRSVAIHWRERAIGVVLTGDLDDGTAGLALIKQAGGAAVVQDPATAFQPAMPSNALANVEADHCVPLQAVGPLLATIAGTATLPASGQVPPIAGYEQAIFEGRNPMEHLNAIGDPSALTCPDCGGGLWEIKGARPLRYRCHTGHAFTASSLGSAQGDVAEQSLWSSVRALQEREMLLLRLATVSEAMGDLAQADAGRRQAEKVKAQAQLLCKLVEGELNSA